MPSERRQADTEDEYVMLRRMADRGLIVSLVYGQCGSLGIMWSVDVLNTNSNESFAKPFAANSLVHAVLIADSQAMQRGW